MNIPKNIYIGLWIAFILLIVLAFFLMVKYNEAKNEKVAELQSEGYVCIKNEFGIYKSCKRPESLNNFNLSLNQSEEKPWLNMSN